MFTIAPIVEGRGDVRAVHRLLGRLFGGPAVRIAVPVRIGKTQMVTPKLARSAELAKANIVSPRNPGATGAVALFVDADQQCAKALAEAIVPELRRSAAPYPTLCVVVVKEFESWLIGGIAELRVADPEATGDPKGRLRTHLGRKYSESTDQHELVQQLDLGLIRQRSRSFARMESRLRQLIEQSNAGTGPAAGVS